MIANFNSEVIIKRNSFTSELDKIKNKKIVLITSKTPYKIFKDHFKNLNYFPIFVKNKKLIELSKIAKTEQFSKADLIIGFGSGSSIDISKVIASSKNIDLLAIPTILSTNVFFTNKSVVFKDARIKTIDSKVPDKVIIDASIIERAPDRFNFSGIADILSIFTALFDWKIAKENKKEQENLIIEKIAQTVLTILKKKCDQLLNKKETFLFRSIEKKKSLLKSLSISPETLQSLQSNFSSWLRTPRE